MLLSISSFALDDSSYEFKIKSIINALRNHFHINNTNVLIFMAHLKTSTWTNVVHEQQWHSDSPSFCD
jgi:hypothetical protein